MKRPGPTLRVHLRETGGWRVSVSPTLIELSVATPGPCEGQNNTYLTKYRYGFDA